MRHEAGAEVRQWPASAFGAEPHASVVDRLAKGVPRDYRQRRALVIARREHLEHERRQFCLNSIAARGGVRSTALNASGAGQPVLAVQRARLLVSTREARAGLQRRPPEPALPVGGFLGLAAHTPGKRELEARLAELHAARSLDEGTQLVEQLLRARRLATTGAAPQAQPRLTWAAFAVNAEARPTSYGMGGGLDYEVELRSASPFLGDRTFVTSGAPSPSRQRTFVTSGAPSPSHQHQPGSASWEEIDPGSPLSPYLAAARDAEEESRLISKVAEEAHTGWMPPERVGEWDILGAWSSSPASARAHYSPGGTRFCSPPRSTQKRQTTSPPPRGVRPGSAVHTVVVPRPGSAAANGQAWPPMQSHRG